MAKSTDVTRNRVRIIGGKWRGSRLDFPTVDGLRPSADRTRETLFNWLQAQIHGSRCLDLFAGSGALGFEALSRGAAYVLMLEKNKHAAQQLQQHKQRLGAVQCEVRQIDALAWLAQQAPVLENGADYQPQPAFDIVFLDPPYSLRLHSQCLQLLEQSALLRQGGLLYFEQPQHEEPIDVSKRWQEIKHKSSGQVSYSLLRFGENT